MEKLIKKVLNEESTEEFIEWRSRMFDRIEKTMPKLINFLKTNLSDKKLYDINVTEVNRAYGSTWVYDEEKGSAGPYRGKCFLLILKFNQLTDSEKREIGNKVYDFIEDIFGLPITKYGTPLDIRFINLEEKEF